MREIKFRAKALTGEWVYGNFIHSKRFEGCSNEFRIHDSETGIEHDIDIETLGQYTGLKDKYDNEIYEGSVCEYGYKHLDIYDKAVIVNKNGCFMFGNCTLAHLMVNDIDVGIIGNIHDNPELLK